MDETVTQTDPDMELWPEPEAEPQPSLQSHPLDPISLAFGAIFAILGAVFLFGDIDAESVSMAWAWAGLFGAIGLLLIAVGVRRYRRDGSVD